LHIEKRAGDAMGIGEMKHRITLQKLATSVNQNGFEINTWQDYNTVWAKVSNLSGREYFQAAGTQAEKTVKFTIRYLQDLNTDLRISFEGKQFNITSIDNIRYEGKYTEIKALEVDSSG
jgi:SPP1 family predicted phage head-tail adaptor